MTKIKKLTSILLAVIMAFSIFTIVPITASAETSGDFEYEVFEDGTAVITSYYGSAETLEIPTELGGYTVTCIGAYAFCGCTSLTSVTIPDSVTSIGADAFDNTEWYYNQPDGIVYVGKFAYDYKGEMPENTSLILEEGTKGIADSAFFECSNIVSVTIPDSVTTIGDFAFIGCSSLTEINIDGNNPNYCDIDGVVYNKDKTELLICPSGKTEVTIPDSVTSISESAFEDCTNLTSVTIPDSVTTIGDWAFDSCTKLTGITIPDSVTSIGSDAFYDTAWYNNQPDGMVYAGKVAYSYKGEMPENTSLILKEGTKGIADSAFYECSNLVSITIPDSIITIGDGAFECCTSLTSVTIPDSVTSIGDSAFRECTILASVTIPDSVTSIGNLAFQFCESLASITIPDSVTTLGYGAFDYCISLTNVTIGNSVTTIDENAFWACKSLTSVTIPDSVTSIGDFAFESCESLTSVTISDSVTSIGNYAFNGCTSLTSVTIPDSVTTIGEYAFGYTLDEETWDFVKIYGFTIYGYEGTAAENYANSYGITFVSLGDVPTTKLGDVNGDGKVSILDATEIQKHLVGLSTLTDEQLKYADAYGDGAISILDATEIQKYIVGLVPSLG